MKQTNGDAPGARRLSRRPQNQRRASGPIKDPTQEFFRRHSKDYEAFERHLYADAVHPSRRYGPEEFRGDTSSDEAFSPLNFGLRRR